MRLDLGPEALEFGGLARRALEGAGGDELAQAAEAAPDGRERPAAEVLEQLGVWSLEPLGSEEELEAAAAACRAAGYWALPYPVAERLARPAGLDADGLVVVDERNPRAAVGGLEGLRWVAVTVDGRRSRAKVLPLAGSARATAYVTALELEPLDQSSGPAGDREVALGLVLPCWTLLGLLDRAVDLTCAYVQQREQFGQALGRFQGVQFQLTDAEVERLGLEQLAKYALWSIQAGRPEAIDDALALRLAALEAAEVVFRTTHQLHGAIGFCDETTLSWISRGSASLRRLPLGLSATRSLLADRLGRQGLTGLYGPGPRS